MRALPRSTAPVPTGAPRLVRVPSGPIRAVLPRRGFAQCGAAVSNTPRTGMLRAAAAADAGGGAGEPEPPAAEEGGSGGGGGGRSSTVSTLTPVISAR